MKTFRRITGFLLALALTLALLPAAPVLATDQSALEAAVNKTAAYMYDTVKNPQVGSVGGEWAVLGLARSGYDVPDTYYQNYYATVEGYVKACSGVLHEKKYTEYSRVVVALTAIGKDPSDVAGYNLLTPLGDFDKTIWQGINGPIWALIALDSGNYAMPVNENAGTQATRQMYVDEILSRQLSDGGWSLFGSTSAAAGSERSDPDISGMALQALAKYQDQPAVNQATEEALSCLSSMQQSDGGFSSWGTVNSESTVQVLVALCELGIPLDDQRFVKNGNTTLDNLLTFQQANGGFLHTSSGSGNNQMSAEQGFYGLVAALRAAEEENSLYRMSDALTIGGEADSLVKGEGLPGKNADVTAVPITSPGLTFSDIRDSDDISAIEALAARGIITGMDDDTFAPESTMTRAQFAAIIVRGLGLTPAFRGTFSDVPEARWYAEYVDTAAAYGIVSGVGDALFNPEGTISRQEAATMVARAAKLCGMDTALDTGAIRNTLAPFGDYVTVSDWARESVAFCCRENILDADALNLLPKETVLRREVAQMLFRLLTAANLI